MARALSTVEADHDATLRVARNTVLQIEDFVADGSLLDAIKSLQDMTRDFAPGFTEDSVELSVRCDALLRRFREAAARNLINELRLSCLALTYRVYRVACGIDAPSAVPAASSVAAPDQSPDASTSTDQEPVAPSRGAGQSEIPTEAPEEVTRRHFEQVWRSDRSIVVGVRGVSKAYKSNAFNLEPISFELKMGQITGVVGRNASGKTTLLRIVLGQLAPDTGTVLYPTLGGPTGANWRIIKPKVAYLPQHPDEWFGPLRYNLNFVAAAHAAQGEDPSDIIDWCVARYDLKRYEYATWKTISGGYRTRFELVRALVCKPKVLILDEPLAFLDVIARQRFLRDLRTIATSFSNPIPILITSQHLHEIEAVADQLIYLDDGVCRHAGPLADIAKSAEQRMFEVAVLAMRDEVVGALQGLGLTRAQRTMDGFILVFPLPVDGADVFKRLRAAFRDRFIAFRDITSSARSLMTEEVE